MHLFRRLYIWRLLFHPTRTSRRYYYVCVHTTIDANNKSEFNTDETSISVLGKFEKSRSGSRFRNVPGVSVCVYVHAFY